MPAIVVLGAQWGDEGKGKATDLLGSRVDYVVKFNGGNNAGHTVVIGDQKYALHLLPSGILTPGCTPVIGNGVVVDLAVLFEELDGARRARHRRQRAAGQRQRARDRRLQPHARQGDRAVPRRPPDRHDRPRHRSDVRRQDEPDRHPGPGPVRREDPAARRSRASLELKNQVLAKIYNRRAPSVEATVEELLAYADRLRADGLRQRAAAQPGARPRRDGAARGRPGDAARRRPRHLPVRDVLVGDRRRRLHRLGHPADPDRPGDRRSSRPTRPASARARSRPSCSTTTASTCARSAREYGTTTGRPRRCGWYDAVIARYAARVNGVTDFVADQARRARRAGAGPGLRGLRRRRHAPRRDAGEPDRLPPRQCRSTSTSPAGGRTSPGPHLRRPAGQRPGVRRARSRSCPVRGSPRSASGRPETRRSSSCAERAESPRDRGNWPLP